MLWKECKHVGYLFQRGDKQEQNCSQSQPSPQLKEGIQRPKPVERAKTYNQIEQQLLQPPLQQQEFFQHTQLAPQEQNNIEITHCPGNCGNGFIFEGDNYEFFCENCLQTYCLKCRRIFHFNKTCEQAQTYQNIQVKQNLDDQFEKGQHLSRFGRYRSLLQSAAYHEGAYKQVQRINNVDNLYFPTKHLNPIKDQVAYDLNPAQPSEQDRLQKEYWHSQFINMIITYADQYVDCKQMLADCFILALQLGRFQTQYNDLEWVPNLNSILYSIQVLNLQYSAKLHLITEFIYDFHKDFHDLIEIQQVDYEQIIFHDYPINQFFVTVESQQNNFVDKQTNLRKILIVVFVLGLEWGRNAQIHLDSGKDLIQRLLDFIQELKFSNQGKNIRYIIDQLLNELIQTRTSQLHTLLNRQCPICLEAIYYPNLAKIEPCQHFFHKECLGNHIDQSLLTSPNQIKCPETCNQLLTINQIQERMNKWLFQQNPELFSICPTASCGYAFIFEGNDNFQFTCPSCLQSYCLQCRVQYHFNMTCTEYRKSRECQSRIRLEKIQDQQFQEFVRGQHFKQCPKCTVWVERISGCLHMTCRCKYQFCYRCGVKHKECTCRE